jgi:protein-tyrosine phosphatase
LSEKTIAENDADIAKNGSGSEYVFDKTSTQTRSIALNGASNFRDLGGYVGLDGRTVRWRRLFRSAHLGDLTAADQATLAGLGLRHVFDFRGVEERLPTPCALPSVQVHSLAIEPTVVQRMSEHLNAGTPLSGAQMVGYMQQTYRDFVHRNTPRFAQLMAHVRADDAPLVFHCTAGKDRTGFAAALILSALGVSRDAIMADYLLTNQLLRRTLHIASQLPQEARDVLEGVQPAFLDAAWEVLDADYGGMDAYLTHQMGLGAADRARLAGLYLEA